jgi:hypothetical protein
MFLKRFQQIKEEQLVLERKQTDLLSKILEELKIINEKYN